MPSMRPLEGRPAQCQLRISSDQAMNVSTVPWYSGQLAGLVEVAEPSERVERALVVVGGVEAVELLQGLPAGPQPRVGVEEPVEAGRGRCR